MPIQGNKQQEVGKLLEPNQKEALDALLLTDSDLKALLEKYQWEKLQASAKDAEESEIYEFAQYISKRLENLEGEIRNLAARKNIKVYDISNIDQFFSKKELSLEENVYNTLAAVLFMVQSMINVHLAVVVLREIVRLEIRQRKILNQR